MLSLRSMVIFLLSGLENGPAPLHAGRHVSHRQNLDVPEVAGSNQPLQDAFEERKTVARFGQVFGMKTEVKDPSMAGRSFQSPAESLDAGSQCDHSAPRRSDGVEEH